MLLKHVYQELNKYLKEFDTNIVGIKKVGSEIIFKVKDDVRIRQKQKDNEQDNKFKIKEE